MFLFRSVYTQSVASFRENYQDHWISYTGDGKTNWTDYIKVEKDVNFKNFFYGGVEGKKKKGVLDTDGHLVATTHPSSSFTS
jgi:hypothetical protein